MMTILEVEQQYLVTGHCDNEEREGSGAGNPLCHKGLLQVWGGEFPYHGNWGVAMVLDSCICCAWSVSD